MCGTFNAPDVAQLCRSVSSADIMKGCFSVGLATQKESFARTMAFTALLDIGGRGRRSLVYDVDAAIGVDGVDRGLACN